MACSWAWPEAQAAPALDRIGRIVLTRLPAAVLASQSRSQIMAAG
jgi:hypothetical protein